MSSLDQQQFVDYHDYISLQLERTRRHIRSTDLMTAIAGGVGILLTYLLTFVVLDHWVIEGGFSTTARILMLMSVLLLTAGWFVWRVSRPAFNQINSLFAARTLDTAKPDLHNILLTLIDIRRHNKKVAPEIEQSLEKRAALGISKLQIDQTVDHTNLMRSLYFLLAIVVIFALYALLSPKQIAGTLLRAVAPSVDIQAATQTQINNVSPGKDIEVPARSQVEISALITGEIPEEVLIKYTTDDRRYVDEVVVMKPVDGDAKGKYAAILAGENGRGLQQNHSYYIEAGDAKTSSYLVKVKATPVAKVDQIFLQPPPYTKLEPVTIQTGDIDALEGTKVAISASVSMPVKTARIRFSDTEDMAQKAEEVTMSVNDGTKLTAELPPLKIRSNGTFPRFYHIECKTEDGASDPAPVLYRMNIRPDQPPMVRLKSPTGDLVQPANGIIPLVVEAQDPDFLLHSLTLRVEKAGERIHAEPLFEKRVNGTRVKYDWRLESLHLLDGDEIAFWVEARDNKEPAANLSNTQKIRVKIQPPQDDAKVEKALEEQKAQQKKQEEKEQQEADQKGENPQQPQQPGQEQQADGAQKNEGDQKKQQQQKMSDQPQQGEKSPQNGEKSEQKKGEGESGNNGDGDSENQKSGETSEKGESQQDGKMSDSKTEDGGESGEQKNPQKGENKSGNNNSGENQQEKNSSGDQNGQKQNGQQKSGKQNQKQDGQDGMSEQGEKGDQSKPSDQQQFDKEGADDDLVLNELMREHQKKEQEKNKKNEGDSQSPDGEASPDGKEGSEGQQKNDGQNKPSEGMNDDQSPSKDGKDQSKEKTDGNPTDGKSDDGKPGDDKGEQKNSETMSKENKENSGEETKPGTKGEQKDGEKPADEKSKDGGASGEQEKNDGNKPPEGMEKKGGSGGEKSDEKPMGDEPKDGKGGDQPSEKMNSEKDGNSPSKASPDDKGKEGTSPDPNAPKGKNEAAPDKDATGKPADDPNAEAMKSDKNVKREEGTKPTTREGDPNDPNRKPENQAKGGDKDKPDQSSDKNQSGEKQNGQKQDGQPQNGQKTDGSQNESQNAGGDSAGDKSKNSGDMQDGKSQGGKSEGDSSKKGSSEGQPGEGKSENSQEGDTNGGQSGMNQDGQKPGGEQKQGENQKQDDIPQKPSEKQGGGEQKMNGEKQGGQDQGGQQQQQQQDGKSGGQSEGKSGDSGAGGKGDQPGQGAQPGSPGSKPSESGGGGAPGKENAPNGKAGNANQAEQKENDQPMKNDAAGNGPSKSSPQQQQPSLEDKKKAADLVLKQLEEDLKRGDVDEEFLKRLGWNETDLKKFRDRMAKMFQEKETLTPEELARRKQYQEMLKNLNLNTNRPAAKSSQGFGKSEVDSFGPSNIPAPAQYQELERAYKESLLKKKD